MKKAVTNKRGYDYLTNFFRLHSIVALCCGILTLMIAFYGVILGVIIMMENTDEGGFAGFMYFTMISNTIAACSIAFIIPYAVDGIQKKRFVLPKWVAMMHYISATSIAIVMAFVLCLMSWVNPKEAFGGNGVALHIFCPILILISFFQIENRHIYSVKERFIGCIPFCIYTIIYYIEVVLIGKENGGWRDIYYIQEYTSPEIAIPLLLILGAVISWTIAVISNYFTRMREKKMFSKWKDDIDPIEAKIEAFGLGNRSGKVKDKSSITIPMDILEYIAQKTHVNTEDLIKPYVEGVVVAYRKAHCTRGRPLNVQKNNDLPPY